MAYLDRDGVRVHYEDSGGNGGDDRMPILLTHGFSASTGMWRGQVEALGGQYRLIRMDMRGHGETLCHMDDDLFSQHHVVEDMRALLDHLGIEKAVIGGHSLGGFMSLTSIAVPTLVIIGDGDSDFLEGSNYMAGRIPGAINVVVPGGGHGINVDQPEAVNRALGAFLATL